MHITIIGEIKIDFGFYFIFPPSFPFRRRFTVCMSLFWDVYSTILVQYSASSVGLCLISWKSLLVTRGAMFLSLLC